MTDKGGYTQSRGIGLKGGIKSFSEYYGVLFVFPLGVTVFQDYIAVRATSHNSLFSFF